ncbi:MAG: A24 family peptidase [Gemmataceae bacterium]|nr:A24 family peptidase [Gemmataceae bacterium]
MTRCRSTLRDLYRSLIRVPAVGRWAAGFALPVIVGVPSLAIGCSPGETACLVLVALLAVVTVTDLLWRRIFNWLVGPALLAALGLAAAGGTLPAALLGASSCFAAMLSLYVLFGGGEGDVKLFAVVGAALGVHAGIEVLLGGHLLAAGVAILIVLARLARRRTGSLLAGHLPMAPFFALAAALVAVTN